ncbi:MAG: hypothetical protein AW07_02428 [Candidatus Accumulibacter sp. SK-11]|nr:MAG: hypothetical protein AW07_02428 [Candidatus Accumulibacter sp. SK-11]
MSSETFIRKSSVQSTPIGMLSFGTSWFHVFSTSFFVLSSWNGCSRMVLMAFGASLISPCVVPPAYIRNSPSAGVSSTSLGSESSVASTSISAIIRLMTRKLPR